jgi:CID domain
MITEYCRNDIIVLYLISDILYNCSRVDIQYSWSYLPLIESKLPQIMEKLKYSQTAMKVISVWENWGIFDKKYLLGLKSIINQQEFQDNLLLKTYKDLLLLCDEYYIKNKCKECGQLLVSDKETQISKILYFINYLVITASIKQDWVYVSIDSTGTCPEKVIEAVDNTLDLFLSPQVHGEKISSSDLQVIKKLVNKHPGTYISRHS